MTNSRPLSWIDPTRWAGLLAKVTEELPPVGGPSPPRGARVASPRRGASPTRPPPPAAAPRARSRPSTTSPPAGAAPPARSRPDTLPLPNVPPVPPARPAGYPAFVSSSLQLEERLVALVAWIADSVPCRAAFVADDNGLPVVEHRGADPEHIAAASSILHMLASVRTVMRDGGGWLSLKLGAAALNVVEVATRWGRFAIGVVTDDALPREFLVVLSAAVQRAFHGESPQGEAT